MNLESKAAGEVVIVSSENASLTDLRSRLETSRRCLPGVISSSKGECSEWKSLYRLFCHFVLIFITRIAMLLPSTKLQFHQ